MKNFIISFLMFIVLINVGFYAQQLHRTGLLFEDISKNTSIRKAEPKTVLYKLSSSVDNSDHLPPVGNQGQQGSCVAWAIGYYYKTYQEWQEHGWSITVPNHIFSPSFIYNHINGGRDGGSYFSDALKLLTDNGCATIADFPYQNYTALPSESVYLDAIKYRSLDAYYIPINNTTGIEQVKQHLANGDIAVLGIIIYGNFDNIKNYNNTYCVNEKMGNNRGGHALAIVGYDDNKVTADGTGAFRLVNSWGTSWGDNGFCWMSYQAVIDTNLSQRFACYTTDRIQYEPTIIASTQITHSNINFLKLNFGIGLNSTPIYSKNYFDFYMNTLPGLPARSFPNNNIDFDLSDGLSYLDTTQSNNVFLSTQSTVSGTVNNFSITDLRVHYITTSSETPKTIPDNNESVFTNIDLRIVNESNIICTDVTLLQGWNIVSVPVIATNMSTSILFAGANSPTYNYTDKYNIATTLENGKGYWVRYPIATTINICGNIVNSNTIPVTEGWNLVGVYERNVNINQVTTEPWGIVNSPFYGYSNKYEIPTVMEVGKSYWVRASGAGVINIGNALAKRINQTIVKESIDPKWIKIIVRDNNGNRSIVYGASESINFDSYALPPIPPSGVFDVRWDSNQLVDNINNGTKDILIHSAEYPITLKVEGGNLSIKDKVGGVVINAVVRDGQSIVITNPAIESFHVNTVVFPITFKLFQNYPNPFNPTTTIEYVLPYNSRVKVEIFNMLGQLITTLIDKEESAGYKQVLWNANDLSSGIYIMRMNAEAVEGGNKFSSTKKLLLLK
ncbi:MAG: T9SS type A sorting domain-containing protein [Ignavibacteriales bacterium]|nr:T9SS type A sorting domain-containing protein [Ignavibacteriales bacterium]